jgi:glycosyltransferase involved in cell wall biosynthesis
VTRRALESLYREMAPGFRLVYVDGGSPPAVARYLAAESKARGFELIRTERFLAPNEARNLGLRHATGRYVLFVENDVLVAPAVSLRSSGAPRRPAPISSARSTPRRAGAGFVHMARATASKKRTANAG